MLQKLVLEQVFALLSIFYDLDFEAKTKLKDLSICGDGCKSKFILKSFTRWKRLQNAKHLLMR